MHNELIRNIEVEPCGRLLNRLVGPTAGTAVCDRAGVPVWSIGQIEEVLAEVRSGRGFAPGTGAIDLGAAGRLLLESIGEAADALGYLAVLRPAAVPLAQPEAEVRESLQELAGLFHQKIVLGQELDGMTAELAARYDELHLVYGLSDTFRHLDQEEAICRRLLETCLNFLKVDLAVFSFPEKNLFLHAQSPDRPLADRDLALLRLQGRIYQFIATARETTVINQADDPRRAYLYTDPAHKVLASPVVIDDRAKAMFALLRGGSGADFTNSDRKLLEVLADQAGGVLRNQDLLKGMELFTDQMVTALVEAVDAKDAYTRGHSERVNRYAMQIGAALDLPQEERPALYWGSLLHDLGKIGIPDLILGKAGPLDADERIVIMGHPERGQEILCKVRRLQKALPGIRHHHERFDGSGYPDRLGGGEIPLLARIIAVADVYDAITCSRAYRSASPSQLALDELRQVAGSQLDPQVVATFCQVIDASNTASQEV